MPYDLPIILFPLVGGYSILIHTILFRDQYNRISPQKLIFESIIAGIFLFFTTCIIRMFVSYLPFPLFDLIWNFFQSLPYHTPLLGTAIFSFIFAIIFTYLINRLYNKKIFLKKRFKIINKAIRKYGDELENIFLKAFISRELIQVTLKNNKVYVGFVTELYEPKKADYVTIFPIISGYRKPVNKIIKFTTLYREVFKIFEKEEKNLVPKDLKIIIKKDEILTATIFYPEIYDKFQELAKTDNDSSNKNISPI